MSAAALSPEKIESLYVHVPFCGHKCEYCAFYSKLPSTDMVNGYVDALVREMEMVAEDLRPKTVFFGGGTPSLLSISQWRKILEAMERLDLLGAEEWTVECNPATVSEDKAKLLRDFGVNRISMGVQSLDESLLERLGRIHSRKQVFQSHEILRGAGFENINLDLMFGIPTQTMEIWRRTLDEIVGLETEHLSCYEVIYEEDTPLFEQLQAGQFDVDEDLIEDMYDALLDRSSAAAFEQYEVANFEKPVLPASCRQSEGELRAEGDLDCRRDAGSTGCRHNVNYWRGGSFYGLGPSATEYVRGTRRKGWSNTQLYVERIQSGQRAHEHSETLPDLGRAGETAAFGLRMNRGWGFDEFQRVTGFDLREHWSEEMNDLIEDDLGEMTPEGFRLTRRGLRFADTAAAMFLRPEAA